MSKKRNKIDVFHKVFETKWFSVEASSDKFSSEEPYYRLSCNDSVEILAVTPQQKIILVRQFRPALGIHTLEFPSGYVDNAEEAKDAIEREFREETGFICDSVIPMGSFKVVPSRINNTLYFFFGRGAKAKDLSQESGDFEVVSVTENEFKKLINNQTFVEVAGIAIYSLAKLKGFL